MGNQQSTITNINKMLYKKDYNLQAVDWKLFYYINNNLVPVSNYTGSEKDIKSICIVVKDPIVIYYFFNPIYNVDKYEAVIFEYPFSERLLYKLLLKLNEPINLPCSKGLPFITETTIQPITKEEPY